MRDRLAHLHFLFTVCLLTIGLIPVHATEPEPAAQWIAVVAPAYREAIAPLCEHRRGEGMKVVVLRTDEVDPNALAVTDAAMPLQRKVHELIRTWPGRSYVLLVGAVGVEDPGDAAARVVPAGSGRIGRMMGQPTDNAYGWKNDENPQILPDVAVGRMPARTVEEARAMVEKTLRGEKAGVGPWKHRMTFLAGSPSYYPALDKMIESMAMSTLDKLSPRWALRAVYYHPNSTFTLPESRIGRQTSAYLVEGQAIIVYMGHSGVEGFWYAGPDWQPLMSREEFGRVDLSAGTCVFTTFGCNGAQLSGKDGEGYGVWAMRNPHGPVAVVGSHGECDAAMSLLMSNGLLKCLAEESGAVRMGDLWMSMIGNLAKGRLNPILHRLLDEVDGDTKVPHDIRRKDHLEMFVLLGDPAFKLPAIGHSLKLEMAAEVSPGAKVTIKAAVPRALAGAKGLLTLERAPTDPPAGLKPLPARGEDGHEAAMVANHEASNRIVVASQAVQVAGDAVSMDVEVPGRCAWERLCVRLYVATEKADGMGVGMLKVRQPESKPVTNGVQDVKAG